MSQDRESLKTHTLSTDVRRCVAVCSLQEETSGGEATGQHYLSCMARLAAVFGRLQSALTVLASQGKNGSSSSLGAVLSEPVWQSNIMMLFVLPH